ncbi:MAG: nucleotide sugar dehydrogenase [Woeseiaceae bacterium]|nr:nucleotide sugar dehydrogenase [Woeseiaceae bacterium]
MSFDIKNLRIGIIGLGYVGLPLAVEFGKKYPTMGFDIKPERIAELESGHDSTLEASDEELAAARQLTYTTSVEDLSDCNFYVVTVPTPIGENSRPIMSPLSSASASLGKIVSKSDIVVFESTVYPGATEEFCIPIIEQESGLRFNVDFFAGYSPERINPGDKLRPLRKILKVTSGSTPEVAEFIDEVYRSIIEAGTHLASSIKVAEASKVIENTQRDVNIALINELAMIFERVGIDTEEVLEAAGTKWNFLPFRPGLVGGHCIGVDPYYLTFKAQRLGYHPQMILACRRINDNMPLYVASQIIKLMLKHSIQPRGARALVLGLAFKEDCPDVRNSKVVDIVSELESYGTNVDVYDPWVDAGEARDEYQIELLEEPERGSYDVVIVAVAHSIFKEQGAQGVRAYGNGNSVVYDIKYVLPADASDDRL